MPDWAKLQHAYGPASDVPGLLKRLSPDPKAAVWDELWSRLCHQGTVYTASFAALPALLQTAAGWLPQDRVMALSLAAAIVSSDDVQGLREMRDLAVTTAAFAGLSEESLAGAGLSDNEFLYLAQAALAFQGDRFWGRELDHLAAGEFEGRCVSCSADLYLVIGSYGLFATADEWVNRPMAKRVPIRPALTELAGVARWLHDQAFRSGHPLVGLWVQHLFGETECPACGSTFSVEDAIRAVSGPAC